MNKIQLPTLKSINIKEFSLFPNGLDFKYDFIEGVNLIIGGNGIGKTTLVHLIKYGLIGLYKKELEVKRRLEARIEKRANLPYNFFSNRMDHTYPENEDSEVVFTFNIGSKEFEVTRGVYEIILKKVVISENGNSRKLEGKLVSQREYDELTRYERTSKKIKDTLQFKYEDEVTKASNLSDFNSLIFFANEILTFGESRRTILWDSEIQSKLSSKYFNDPLLDKRKEESERDAKYYDSLGRHKSEEIKAINRVIKKITETDEPDKNIKNVLKGIEKVKNDIEAFEKNLDDIHKERSQLDVNLNIKHSDLNRVRKKLDEAQENRRAEEIKFYTDLWKKLNPKYEIYLKFIHNEQDCPLCNNALTKEVSNRIIKNENCCMLCQSQIGEDLKETESLLKIKTNINKLFSQRRSIETEIVNIQERLKDLDYKFNKITVELNKAQSELRRLEYGLQKKDKEKASFELKAMAEQITKLEKEKNENHEKSRMFKAKAGKIEAKLDNERIKITKDLSGIFSDLAQQFLGVDCKLIYDDFKDGMGKRYVPVIDEMVRKQEEELSESQRFFIDQAFRMSLLNFFYTEPAFFICETPDSSLDISYEENAAKIFLEYLKLPNSLIITSNLNNSGFLDYIVKNANNIQVVNLLDIGRQSNIQANSKQLATILKRLKGTINARKKQ